MERMRQLREEKGLSQAQAAVRAGMDPSTWNRLEQGKGNPNLKTLERVAEALGVEVADLFEAREAPRADRWAVEAPQIRHEQLTERGVHPTDSEFIMLNRLLQAYYELAQTGEEKTTVTAPDYLPEPVDMERVYLLVDYALLSGILTRKDVERLTQGIRTKLARG